MQLVTQVTKMAGASDAALATAKLAAGEAAAAGAAAAAAATAKNEVGSSPKLHPKDFTRVKVFEDESTRSWKEWAFDFKVIVIAINPALEWWFSSIENEHLAHDPLTIEMIRNTCNGGQGQGQGQGPKDVEARSKELFGILCSVTDGEAKTIIRGQTDGLVAYQLLHRTYSRVTLAKTIRIVKDALVPKKAAYLGEVIIRITDWENKLIELEKLDPNYKSRR